MSVLLIVEPKCTKSTLAASHADLWRVTVSMLTGRIPDRYNTVSATRGQRNKRKTFGLN